MVFAEILRLSLHSLGANKLRTFLTMLGIAVGVFSVIGVMTAISAMESQISSGLNVLGANSFQISKFPALQMGGPDNRAANRRDVTYTQARRFRDAVEPAGGVVSLLLRRGGRSASYADRRTNPNNILGGGDENFLASRQYTVAQGRNLTAEDVDFGRPVTVIGQDVVKRLFPNNEDPIEKTIRVDGQNYTVVGTLAEKGSLFGSSQDNFILIPITRFLQVYGQSRRSISINVQAPDAASIPALQDVAIGAMRTVRGLRPEDSNDFEVFSNDSLVRAFEEISGVVAVGAFVISAIALLAAGVGIMNIMLVAVTERTKEIGVRKSIGARRTAILRQFLTEAVIISLLGGLMGIAVGVAGGNGIALAMGFDVVLPWAWIGFGLGICAAIGIGFGYYPARRAAGLDPIEALRFE